MTQGYVQQKRRGKRDEDEYFCDFAPIPPPVPDGAPGWLRSRDGTWTRVLYDSLDSTTQTGHKSLLLYIPPGISLPPLELPVWQEVIVVSGALNWLNADDTIQETIRPYAHVIRPPGMPYGPLSTDEHGPGCTLFCKWFYATNAITDSVVPQGLATQGGYVTDMARYGQGDIQAMYPGMTEEEAQMHAHMQASVLMEGQYGGYEGAVYQHMQHGAEVGQQQGGMSGTGAPGNV